MTLPPKLHYLHLGYQAPDSHGAETKDGRVLIVNPPHCYIGKHRTDCTATPSEDA